MNVGDRVAGYLAGLEAGYYLRVGEENDRWVRSYTRSDVSEPVAFVTVGGVPVKRWTWREREAARLEVLREAHAAGLHDERSAERAGCIGCKR